MVEAWDLEVAGVVVEMAGVMVAEGAMAMGDLVVAMVGMAEGIQGALEGMVAGKAQPVEQVGSAADRRGAEGQDKAVVDMLVVERLAAEGLAAAVVEDSVRAAACLLREGKAQLSGNVLCSLRLINRETH